MIIEGSFFDACKALMGSYAVQIAALATTVFLLWRINTTNKELPGEFDTKWLETARCELWFLIVVHAICASTRLLERFSDQVATLATGVIGMVFSSLVLIDLCHRWIFSDAQHTFSNKDEVKLRQQ